MANPYRDAKGRFASKGGAGVRGSLGGMVGKAMRPAVGAAQVRQARAKIASLDTQLKTARGKRFEQLAAPRRALAKRVRAAEANPAKVRATTRAIGRASRGKAVEMAAQAARAKRSTAAALGAAKPPAPLKPKRPSKPRSLPMSKGKPRALATSGLNRVREQAVLRMEKRSYSRSGDQQHATRLDRRMTRDWIPWDQKQVGRALRGGVSRRSSGTTTTKGAGRASSVRAPKPRMSMGKTGTVKTTRATRASTAKTTQAKTPSWAEMGQMLRSLPPATTKSTKRTSRRKR